MSCMLARDVSVICVCIPFDICPNTHVYVECVCVGPKATWNDLGDVEDEHLCTICLEELEDDDLISPLRCKHQFHHQCTASWLTSRVMGGFMGCCPTCNHQVCSPVFEARTTSDDLSPATANSSRLEQLALTLPPRPRGTALPRVPASRRQDIVKPVHSANHRPQARLSFFSRYFR